MFPFLDFKIFKLPMYGLSIVTGIFVAGFICYKLCKLYKKDIYDFILISAVILGFGFAFAKILYILVTYPIKDFFKVILFMLKNPEERSSGFVFYGGLIGGVLGYYVGIKIIKAKFLDYTDYFAIAIPIVHGFGRIGCFCAGCCYGIPYEGIFSVHYTNPLSSVPTGIGIFPVQLLETFLLFILAAILIILFLKNIKHLFLIYGFFYSIIRFILEYFRFDFERGQIGILSVSQFISICIFLICFSLYIYFFIKERKTK